MNSGTERWLHAVFASEAGVRDALGQLAQDGVPAKDVEIRSSAPLAQDILPVRLRPASHVFRSATIGGLLGGTAFFLMVKLTSEAYPLPTGGLPRLALPPTGVITFEGIAIGAILSAVATVLYESGLPARWRHGPLDHYLADDYILVTVRCTDDASTAWTSQAIDTMRS
jgi:hypothetical protein